MTNSFWWGHGRTNQHGINWLNWEKLSMHKNHGGMGFKDLTAFNLAMLGKQGCKLHTMPESLVFRIFKAQYFPSTSYLTANLGHNPSYDWRSILRARFIVCGGARWSIGTVFSHDIASAIINTPLFSKVQHDRIIWKAENDGKYSVRSAYTLCVEELIDTSFLRRPGYWSDIWRLKVPPKIKNFMWRVCRGVLPTRNKLRDKGVQCPEACVNCSTTSEDVKHLFCVCTFDVQVWQLSDLWSEIQQAVIHFDTASAVIFDLLQRFTLEQSQIFVTMWSLWKRRNLKVWENKNESCAMTVDRARVMMEEWQLATATRSAPTHQHTHLQNPSAATAQQPVVHLQQSHVASAVSAQQSLVPSISWERPSRGRFKCNVDAGFSTSKNRIGIGICVRDDDGAYVLAKTISFDVVHPVRVGEALGLYHALEWLSDMQFDNMDFAMDSKITYDAFNSQKDDISEFGHIISARQSLFSTHFTNSRVEFIRRQANAAAHAFAGEATSLTSPVIYFNIPRCINNIIFNEML
nr:Polynucleotidyl transferase, Ribonuclease H fold [Medicago truncatula]